LSGDFPEPGVDRSNLSARKKHQIGPLKSKQQLIKALQKTAGKEPA